MSFLDKLADTPSERYVLGTNIYSRVGIVGDRFVMADQTISNTGVTPSTLSPSLQETPASLFHEHGAWLSAALMTRSICSEDARRHVFVYCCGLASPIVAMCGLPPMVVNAYGPADCGKTVLGNLIAMQYGHPSLVIETTTTPADIQKRIAYYGEFPVVLDMPPTVDARHFRDFYPAHAKTYGETRKGVTIILSRNPISIDRAKGIQVPLDVIDAYRLTNIYLKREQAYGVAGRKVMESVLKSPNVIKIVKRQALKLAKTHNVSGSQQWLCWLTACAMKAGSFAHRHRMFGRMKLKELLVTTFDELLTKE